MAQYQPKLNLEMVRLGYLGANPSVVGLTGGYQNRMTPEPPKAQQPAQPAKRKNPYMK